jgi:signal transduction histidine kinase
MPRRTYLMDAAVALALTAASMVVGYGMFFPPEPIRKLGRSVDPGALGGWSELQRGILLWWLFAAICAAGVAIQHRWPVLAVALTAVGVGAHLIGGYFKTLPIDLCVLFPLYTLASLNRPRWISWAALATLTVGLYTCIAASELMTNRRAADIKGSAGVASTGTVLYNAATTYYSVGLLVVLAFVVGSGVRGRRALFQALEQRAADLERERDQRAALAAAAERARIIRELHDVVAHGLSVMVVQAQGAAAALARHPERTADALTHVVGTGRASLAEMRRLLGVVRKEPGEGAVLVPQPGIGTLPALVDDVRAAGTEVALRVEGQPEALPPSVDLCAYRIVQEALTNVLKHAGPDARASVRLAFAPDRLDIEVADDGCGTVSTVEHGNGLRGIAERVALFGGRLQVHPVDGGGFRVHAELPLDALEPVRA